MVSYNITDQDGEILVRTARKIITEHIRTGRGQDPGEDFKVKFATESGIFVTLNLQNELRGCIGFPMPQKLDKAIVDASIAAATQDPRFSPLEPEELDKITIEVTLLSPPVEMKVGDRKMLPSMIKVGRDGLIIKQGHHSGLLLPQVPIEFGWNEKQFLDYTCQKAGLADNCWMDKEARVFSFEGTIFKETEPRGKIIRKEL